jgi:nitroreductase
MSETHPLIRQRRSSRLYDPSRPVPPEDVISLLEAARWAPSSSNRQPWRYIVFDDRTPDSLAQARSVLNPDNQMWAFAAPLLILAVSQDVRSDGRPNPKGQHDLGLATMSLLLQATALGLHCRPMGGFDTHRARQLFNIPEGFTPMVIIAVGYPGSASQAHDSVQEKEAKSRERAPLESMSFGGTWGAPLP